MSKKYPNIEGHIEISHDDNGIFIGGDPQGLRSLAELIKFLADVNQEEISYMPDGERNHIHLQSGFPLSKNSTDTEICRLDAKGTGEFPKRYKPA